MTENLQMSAKCLYLSMHTFTARNQSVQSDTITTRITLLDQPVSTCIENMSAEDEIINQDLMNHYNTITFIRASVLRKGIPWGFEGMNALPSTNE